MAKIKYCAKENKNVGTHSFYGVPLFNGVLTTEEICNEAFDGRSIEPTVAKAAIEEYMKAVRRNLLKGFRCKLGEDFLTIYPNIFVSVKDHEDENGNLVVATADMVKATNAKSRLGCTVSAKFSAEFARQVSWQKVDAQGNAIPEEEGEDITDNGNDNPEPPAVNPEPNTPGGGDNNGEDED